MKPKQSNKEQIVTESAFTFDNDIGVKLGRLVDGKFKTVNCCYLRDIRNDYKFCNSDCAAFSIDALLKFNGDKVVSIRIELKCIGRIVDAVRAE